MLINNNNNKNNTRFVYSLDESQAQNIIWKTFNRLRCIHWEFVVQKKPSWVTNIDIIVIEAT